MAGLVAVGLLAAACGSSSSSPNSTSTTVKATGTPIKVGQIIPVTGPTLALPEFGDATVASIKALNARGGINGHPLVLELCDSKGDPNTEVACATQMVNDHVVATLEDTTIASPTEVQGILSGAGIPRIGVQELSPAELSSPTNFDFTGGLLFTLLGMLQDLIHHGNKKLTVMVPDTPTAPQVKLFMDPLVKNLGAEVVNYVLVSPSSGDYSQYVTQAAQNGATGTAVAAGNAQLIQLASAINQMNSKMTWATSGAALSLTQLKQLGAFAKNTLWVSWNPPISDTVDFSGLNQVQADLKPYERNFSVNTSTSFSVQSWLAVHAFYEVMKSQTGTMTAASVVAAFKVAKNVPMAGLIKTWSPSVPADAAGLSGFVKNISNPWLYMVTYNGTTARTNPSQMFSTFAGLPATFTL